MKKLMFVAAVAAAMTGVCDITSSNCVGYDTVDRNVNQIACCGSMFVKPGVAKYSLAEMTCIGTGTSKIAARKNFIQFYQTGDSPRLDNDRMYYYITSGTNMGWWKKSADGSDFDTKIADPSTILFDVCEGFLCNFPTSGTKIMYSGEVITGKDKLITFNRPAGTRQIFVVANPSVGEINLSQLTCANTGTGKVAARKNFIQFFQPGDSARLDDDRMYYYVSSGTSMGWYKKSAAGSNSDTKLEGEALTGVKIGKGEGFLCNFPTPGTSITLPTSL